jgi:hypothetical protein
MKRKPIKKRRAVNIPKEDFDEIKLYCDTNNLRLGPWLGSIAITFIRSDLEYDKLLKKFVVREVGREVI